MMRNMKLSENNSCVCLSAFTRKSSAMLAMATFIFFAAGASVTKATSVNLIFNPGAPGNNIVHGTPCSGTAGGAGGLGIVNGVCDNLQPGDKIVFAVSLDVDGITIDPPAGGINAWSLDLVWDSSLKNVLTLDNAAPPLSYSFVNPSPPPATISYTGYAVVATQQSDDTQAGYAHGVTAATTNVLTLTAADISFRGSSVTFTVDSTDQASIALGFFRTDGAVMGNSLSHMITPNFGQFVIQPADRAVQNDFNQDGIADVLIQKDSGQVYILITETTPDAPSQVNNALSNLVAKVPPGWEIASLADTNGDRRADIILQHTATGLLYVWITQNASPEVPVSIDEPASGSPTTIPSGFSFVGAGDANGDGRADIYVANDTTGLIWTWLTAFDGISFEDGGSPLTMPVNWQLAGIADLDADGTSDVALIRTDGLAYYATTSADGLSFATSGSPGEVPGGWEVIGLGDYGGNLRHDLMAQNTSSGLAYIFSTMAGGLSWAPGGTDGSGPSFRRSGRLDNRRHLQLQRPN